jgi:TPR repeat protein
MKRLLTLIICAAWLHTANASAADSDAILALGLAEYEIGHYAAAAHQFRRAAEMGDARAPEILALMYRYGEQLYGGQIRDDAAEAARWAAVAAERRSRPTTKSVAAAP